MSKIVSSLRCYVDRSSTHGPLRHDDGDTITALHKQLRTEKFLHLKAERGGDRAVLPLRPITQPIIWLGIAIADSCLQFFRPERDAKRKTWQFFVDVPRMIYIALRYNLSPLHYYVYEFHRGPLNHDQIRRFLTGWEFHYLGRRMSRLRGSDVGRLDNKDRFAEFCALNHLPTLPILDLNDPEVCANLMPRDLFAKGSRMFGGEGCFLLSYQADHQKWLLNGQAVAADQLNAQLAEIYQGAPFIVQYRASNHPDMQWLSRRVLTTIRAITAWDPSGNPVVLRTAIRIPKSPDAILDNSTQGGLAAPVDPHSGVINGPAIEWYKVEQTDKPVDSDRSFVGFGLPLWGEVVETLKRAHIASGNYNFLGWDVAITGDGVVLNECNVWSDIELVQVPQKSPFLTDDILACFEAEKCLWEGA